MSFCDDIGYIKKKVCSRWGQFDQPKTQFLVLMCRARVSLRTTREKVESEKGEKA